MKRIILLVVFLVSCVLPVRADEYKWLGNQDEEAATLSYAIPESDALKIDFRCERKTRRVTVTFEHEPPVAKDGIRATIRLTSRETSADVVVNVPATGERLELDDKFVFQGETPMSGNLRRILLDGKVLVVAIDGRREEIPLKGAAQAARHLLATCPPASS